MNILRCVAAVTLAMSLASCWPLEPKFYSTCESAFKDRLKSPSSYRRISLIYSERGISRDEYLKNISTDSEKLRNEYIEMFDNGNVKPILHEAVVDYDAENAFGAVLRNSFRCEYVSSNGDTKNASTLTVLIDGKTSADYLIDALKAGN